MTKDEALKLALEALEEINKLSVGENAICLPAEIDGAMDALRERLAQPEQKPMHHELRKMWEDYFDKCFRAQPEQKPVAWGVFDGPNLHDMFFTQSEAQDMVRLKGDGSTVAHLYTAPSQRTWVGLTDEEIKALASWWPSYDQMPALMVLAKEIQENLKERNT